MPTDKYSNSAYPMPMNGMPLRSMIVKARLFTCSVFFTTKLTELKRLKKLTINVVAVSGKIPNRVKLDTTISPKPNPLRV
ncbi:hypothetical protein KUL156_21840 [Alteromonas sp. KUL156]|nr:hypothetical protein KUL118_58950 [Tenacibaculum sp. KUL118]GFD95694.1 hypothetical protein KUL154_44270 [Alteromonas sp. KUL154]GFD99591.1 hypothetical protein KUL156_21840 [Alteromonas sp. KUL156]